ncbi:MAG: DUF2971 domain-containing protein [Pseudomonadota bacterium]
MDHNQTLPSVLYKYRADSEWTEGILLKKSVWLSKAANLNDPLECRTGAIQNAWKQETIRELEEGQILGVVAAPPNFMPPETLFSLTPRDTRRWVKTFLAMSHSERMKAMRKLYSAHGIDLSRPDKLMDNLSRQLAEVGIFSMSTNPVSQLMWSHYGGIHSGIALGFAVTAECKFADPLHLIKVTYQDQKPVFDKGFMNQVDIGYDSKGRQWSRQKFSLEDPVLRAAFSTKPVDWSYESEWRYIEEEEGEFSWPAPLAEVVFGLRMPVERRRKYTDMARRAAGEGVKFFEIAISQDGSSFERLQLN